MVESLITFVCFQSAEDRYKELENEKLLVNKRLESEKSEFEKKLNDVDAERRDLLDRNRVIRTNQYSELY